MSRNPAASDWIPRTLRDVPEPVAPVVERSVTVVTAPDPLPRPKRWVFIPERDQDNLIVAIVATPEY